MIVLITLILIFCFVYFFYKDNKKDLDTITLYRKNQQCKIIKKLNKK